MTSDSNDVVTGYPLTTGYQTGTLTSGDEASSDATTVGDEVTTDGDSATTETSDSSTDDSSTTTDDTGTNDETTDGTGTDVVPVEASVIPE